MSVSFAPPRRLLRLALGGVTAAAALTALGVAPASAATGLVYVSHGSLHTGPGTGSCAHPDAATVQDGVDAVDPGGTVVVCRGTYHESVTIPKLLVLRGERGAVLDATGRGYGIGIGADGDTVAGMTVTGAEVIGAPPTGLPGDGIVSAALNGGPPVIADHVRLIGNVTRGNGGAGIDLNSTDGSLAWHNRSYGNGMVGINVADDLGRPASNNKIIGNWSTDNVHGCGIALADHTGAGVIDYAVLGNVTDRNGTASGGAGVLLASPVPGAVLRGNLIAGNRASGNGHAGFELHAHQTGDDISGNRVVGNVFGRNNLLGDADDPATTGVYLGSQSPLTITVSGNRIADDRIGIFAAGPVELIAHGNRFSHVAHPVVTQPTYTG
jgi:nitrous oxidase accessory protein NosD